MSVSTALGSRLDNLGDYLVVLHDSDKNLFGHLSTAPGVDWETGILPGSDKNMSCYLSTTLGSRFEKLGTTTCPTSCLLPQE